jgi:hypothetical protein
MSLETIPDFNNYLLACGSPDKATRKNAEDAIRAFKTQDSIKFICSLISAVCDEGAPKAARQMAAIVFKNALINATRDEGANDMWG